MTAKTGSTTSRRADTDEVAGVPELRCDGSEPVSALGRSAGDLGDELLDGLVGERGSTPREWRLSFLKRRAAREARDKVLAWNPRRLVIAHGHCASEGAPEIIERALAWLGRAEPRPTA